ncbi:hypothetical protein Q5752_006640 [Cryptotrichosporon argae]
MQPTSYTPATAVQPSIDVVAAQPQGKTMMAAPAAKGDSNQSEAQRLRGGCPGHFCGLPILPCPIDICVCCI